LRLSEEGVTLIKTSEAFRPRLYNCPAGHCTIGYGHLVHYGATGIGSPKKGVSRARALALEAPFKDGLTEVQAATLLREDLVAYETEVHRVVAVPLDQSEYDALVDFEYNTGALAKSTLLKKLNAQDYEGAAVEFDKWVLANGQRLAGLVIRRDAEEALFRRDLPRVPLHP
jgi:lysozyme